jgi:hypothetical protein
MLSQKSRLLEAIDEARELATRERLPEVVDLLDLAAHASIAGPRRRQIKRRAPPPLALVAERFFPHRRRRERCALELFTYPQVALGSALGRGARTLKNARMMVRRQ